MAAKRIAWSSLSRQERELADDAALLLRRRTLLERFHIPVWELDDVPAEFIDQLMLTLQWSSRS
jgi:hypothetical protein